MSTKAQRLRVARLLDGLACQENREHGIEITGDSDDSVLASTAWRMALSTHRFYDDNVSWRECYAEAAQLLREGSVR